MSSRAYRNIGRGGAGNYYSKADLEEVAERAAQDLEAQNPQSGAAVADNASPPQEYSRLGRGGAGNVTLTALMTAATVSSPPPPADLSQTRQWSGRGGAGNYVGTEQSTATATEELKEVKQVKEAKETKEVKEVKKTKEVKEIKEAKEAKEVQHKIKEAVKVGVEKGLSPPPKAYIGQYMYGGF